MKHAGLAVLAVALTLAAAAGVAHAMPPAPGTNFTTLDLQRRAEEVTRLGIDVSQSPVRDPGAAGSVNTPGDVIILISGTKRFVAVPIQFPDQLLTYSAASFQSMLFGSWASGSARDYFFGQSYGRFNMTGTVTSWYTAANNRAYYGNSAGSQRAAMLAKEAAQAADAAVNYAQYDNNGDGYVDVFTCIHSGYGMEESGNGNDIWSHSWSFSSAGIGAYTTNDPDPVNGGFIRVNEYVIDPERSNYSNNGTMVSIGVFCHEWGHALGLPDLYDVGGTGEGLGNWSLMAAGSWGTNGGSPYYPSSMTAWEKMELGWLNPQAVRARKSYSLTAVESLPQAYWLISRQRTFREYWLVENRVKMGTDRNMYASGLHIFHIDDSIIRARRSSNRVNSNNLSWLYGVDLEEADGLNELYNGTDRGDANDPWPGGLGRTVFDSSTTPASRTNYGGTLISSCLVKNIPSWDTVVSCSMASGVTGAFTGGPDAAGYTWIDSDTTGGPSFNFLDIASTGMFLGSGDEARFNLNLPFSFNFYGTNYTNVYVCTNGWLSFGADPGTNNNVNTSLPAAAAPNRAVYAFWEDLDIVPSDSGGIYYQTFGSAPNRYTVISWVDARVVGSPTYKGYYNQVTFQVVIYEDGRLIVQHKDAACSDSTRSWGRGATVGIENQAGTVGLTYLYNGAPVGNLINNVRAVSFGTNADVGVTAILAPSGTVDSGMPITPQARVQNYSTSTLSFPVTMRIGAGYTNTQNVNNLGPGANTVVSFASWTAGPRGTHAVRCSTELSTDNNRANDTMSGSVTVRVIDAQAVSVIQPPALIDSGQVVPVTAWARNNGTQAATFTVLTTISGTPYSSSQGVIGLNPGDSTLLTFANWTAVQPGAHTVACTTQLAGDLLPTNNRATKGVTVRTTNAAALRITAPIGTVDSGTTVQPRAWVRNMGSVTVTFSATMRIGGSYSNVQNATNLAPGDSVQLAFANWLASQRGTFATACSVALVGDQNPADDKVTGSVTVQVLDAQAVRIVAPVGPLDSGNVVTPQAWVRNRGSAAATFPVTFRIGAFYTNTQNATALNPGDSLLLSFTNWNVLQRGVHAMRCTTQLTGDQVPANNYSDGVITVRLTDVEARSIVAPTGTIDSGTAVTPRAWVRNSGTTAATFTATLRIGGTYTNTQTVTNLAAGDSSQVSFANWTASPRGTFATRCSVYLSGDERPANDVVTGSVTVSVTDAGVALIVAPTGTIDSGASVTPQAWVRNNGSSAASFPVTMRVGTGYTNTQNVTNLAAGDSALVSFASWIARPRGVLAVRCSLQLTGDQRRTNDTLSGVVTVRVTDAAALRIVAPSGLVDTGASITPQAWVRNAGTATVTFSALMTIGSTYSNSQNVVNLAAGDSALVNFTNWIAGPRGVHAVRCSVALAGDLNAGNNVASGVVNVRALDVGVTAIVAPADSVDSGTVVAPQAWIKNFGSGTVSFPVTFRIGAFYSDVQNVTNLASGDSALVTFANWSAVQRGTHALRCTTALTNDAYPFNSYRSGLTTVRVRDAVLARIVAPTGNLDSGQALQPRVVVRNAGSLTAGFPVTFRITPGYSNTQSVSGLAPGDSATVTFASWTPLTGTYDLEAFTALAGEMVPQNDTARGQVTSAPRPDFGVAAIVEPDGVYDAGAVLWPAATWHNYGSRNAAFQAWVLISPPGGGRVYSSRIDVAGLAPGSDTTLNGFAGCTLNLIGPWLAKCSTWADNDADPSNDERSVLFRVERGWTELAPMPNGNSGRACKDGAWVAAMAGADLVYGFKGYGTPEFFSFDEATGAWQMLPDLPTEGSSRPPKKGAEGVTDGNRYVYALRGNNTLDFYRYDAQGSAWERLADVPLGLSGKKVKGGGDLAYVQVGDSGYVYFLKGYRNEFYRYNTGLNEWQTLPEPPMGLKARWNRGSWLVYDDAELLYAHKAKYHELYSFNITLGQWSQTGHLTAMPIPGSAGAKKAKDGSSAAWYRDGINAFKGSNTQEFWRYVVAEDRWFELDTLPRLGSSGRARKVKNGGNLAALGGGVYALKGNRTLEFWRYRGTVAAMDGARPAQQRHGVAAGPAGRAVLDGLRVAPNPVGGHSVVLTLGTSGPAMVRLFDASGRLALERQSPAGPSLVLDTRGLRAGVYLLEVRTATATAQRKLVVGR